MCLAFINDCFYRGSYESCDTSIDQDQNMRSVRFDLNLRCLHKSLMSQLANERLKRFSHLMEGLN